METYNLIKSNPVILYGAGEFGIVAAKILIQFGIIPAYFCDKKKAGIETQTGLRIISPQELFGYGDLNIIIVSEKFNREIRQDLKTIGVDMNKVFDFNDVVRSIPDEPYLIAQFKHYLGYELDIENPKTFNEKLQWLKLYDRNLKYTKLADKYEVRKFVSEVIGEEYLVPIYGVWNNFDDINFDILPNQFVLKCTHDSGGVMICIDKDNYDLKNARSFFSLRLEDNYYYHGREWCYKDIKPRIIAEKYLGDNLNDYKTFAFNGTVRATQVDFNRFTMHERNIYTNDWEYMPFSLKYPTNPKHTVEKPKRLGEMIQIAEKLSTGIPHVRVDLYYFDDKIYFGELTLNHGGGYELFTPSKYDELFGSWIELPKKEQS